MTESFVNSPEQPERATPEGTAGAPERPLAQQKLDVITVLAQAKSNTETASSLGVPARTVENHRNHIMRKMNIASFSDMIGFTVRSNLVAP